MAKTIREVRLTFSEKDKDISEFLKGKSSQTAYKQRKYAIKTGFKSLLLRQNQNR